MLKNRLTLLILSLFLFLGQAVPTFAQSYPVPVDTTPTPTPFGTATPTPSVTPTLSGWGGNGFAGCGGGHGQLPIAAEEGLLLEAINEARVSNGLLPIMVDDGLSNIGQYLAIDMVEEAYGAEATATGEFIIHDRINGELVSICPVTNLWDRPLWGLYTHYDFDYLSPIVEAESVDDMMTELGSSAILSDAAVQRIGVGYAVAADGTPYWMIVFANDYITPTPTPTPSSGSEPASNSCSTDNGFNFSIDATGLAVGDTFEVIPAFDVRVDVWRLWVYDEGGVNEELLVEGGPGMETVQYDTPYIVPVGENRYEIVGERVVYIRMFGDGEERFNTFYPESNLCVESLREAEFMQSNEIMLALGSETLPTSVFGIERSPDIPAGLFIFATVTTVLLFTSIFTVRRSQESGK